MKETDMATVEPKEAGVVRAWRARGSSCGWGRKGRQRPHRTIWVVLGIWVFYSNINENLMKLFVSLECFWGFVGGSGLTFVCFIILAMISFALWKDHSDFLIEKDWREQVGLELEGEGGAHKTYRLRTGGCAETTVPRAAKRAEWGLSMRETRLAKQAEHPGSLREHESPNLAETSLFRSTRHSSFNSSTWHRAG